ncbi:MAG TPA: acetate--CoA ligase family protein [Roseomonas sp.]|jgi:acyl-CoA synthetase (NDP forming)
MSTDLSQALFAPLSQALFAPRAVALIGASADPTKNNSRAQRLLQREGFAGRIVPVNPGRSEVMGVPAFADIRDVDGPVDHAFIMVPSSAVLAAIEGCCQIGVKVATIFSAGFAEAGEAGLALQRQVVATARAGGLRVIGPNCLGLLSVPDRLPLTLNAAIEAEALTPGWLGLVSQSGSMMGALFSRAVARGLGFSRMVSVGNECDLGVGELTEFMVEDPATRIVLLFLETFRDADRLAAAARRAHALGKIIIAYKLGRSELGRQLALSHTGAMVGGDELANAFFRDHGILRVDTLEAMVELPHLVLGHRPPRRRVAAALTATGGGAAMVVDRLGTLGDTVLAPPDEVRTALAAGGIEVPDAPLIDLPMGMSGPARFSTVLKALVASDHCEAVVAVLGSGARLSPETALAHITPAVPASKPLAVFAAPQADETLRLMGERGIAAFRTPESCADAVHAYLNWRAPRPQDGIVAPGETDAAARLLAAVDAKSLNETEACAVFATLGIEPPGSSIVTTPEQVGAIAGPVAIKLLSPDILHKTDAGMVRLDVEGQEAIRATVAELLAAARDRFPAARVDGVLVAPMHRGLQEVILGYREDPEVGPIIMLGIGGVMAELKRSYSVRLAPVDPDEARAMIAELPELRLIQGFRGLPKGDVDALARAVRALSLLATLPGRPVQDAEINPLIIRAEGKGAVAVDGLLTLR